MTKEFLTAMLLTTAAGLATVIGSILTLFVRAPGVGFMSLTLGFSAGVMVTVSFLELLPYSITAVGFVVGNLAFFVGFLFMFAIDFLIPHDFIGQKDRKSDSAYNSKVLKTGMFVAFGIGIHNFPEGMAVFMGSLKDVHFGMAIAVAIGLHNVAEGIAVAVPIYAATKSKKKAFWWSFFSGIVEPLGAVFAGLVLLPFLSPQLFGWLFAGVAGIMVYISFDELIPLSRSCGGKEHMPIIGIFLGLFFMVLSLFLMN